jgi:ribonuclease Z
MDTAPCEGAEELAEGADLLVAESTFSDEDAGLAREFRHLTAGQAGELSATAGARELVLTHFSARYGEDVPVLARQALARSGGAGVTAAADLQRIRLPQRRQGGRNNQVPGHAHG